MVRRAGTTKARRSRSRALVRGLALLVGACTPLRVSLPIRGTLVDSESGNPVPGALITLRAHSECLGIGHPSENLLQETWSMSDASGSFAVGGGVNLLMFPVCFPWTNQL